MSVAQATGSISKGVAMMNAEAHHLQADDTVAKRPNGLNGPGQHVSAYDEALFARHALTIPQFMQDEQLRTTRFPVGEPRATVRAVAPTSPRFRISFAPSCEIVTFTVGL